MRIFKSKSSKFTIGIYPDGKQICLIAGGDGEDYTQPGKDVHVYEIDELPKFYREITFTNYIKQCELLMNEK